MVMASIPRIRIRAIPRRRPGNLVARIMEFSCEDLPRDVEAMPRQVVDRSVAFPAMDELFGIVRGAEDVAVVLVVNPTIGSVVSGRVNRHDLELGLARRIGNRRIDGDPLQVGPQGWRARRGA